MHRLNVLMCDCRTLRGRAAMQGRASWLLTMVLTLTATLGWAAWKGGVPSAQILSQASSGRVSADSRQVFMARVTKVHDGDTVWVQPLSGSSQTPATLKLRLEGIDAPEICQEWGRRSRDALADRILDQIIEVRTDHNDAYGRALAKIGLNGEDVGAWLVLSGHAWSYRYKGDQGLYAEQESQARDVHRGLFADPLAIEPRQFRRDHGPCKGR